MKMNGGIRSLLAVFSVGLAAVGLLLAGGSTAGCVEPSGMLCQSDKECGDDAFCNDSGKCIIRGAEGDGQSDAPEVTEVVRVEVSPAQTEVGLGLSIEMQARAFDANGQQVPGALFEWESSNSTIVSIDSRGRLEGINRGTATITARSAVHPDVEATSQITVVERQVDSVVIEPDPIELFEGETKTAVATAYNDAGEPIDASEAVWTVADEMVATVDTQGVVEALAPGQTQLIANVEGVEESAAIEVRRSPVDRVEISPAQPTAPVGGSVQLEATGYDSDDNTLHDRLTEWTSGDETVATVDADGLVRGVAAGTATIRAEMGVVSSHVTVTITEGNHPPVAGDQTASTLQSSPVDLTLRATDEDGDTLSFRLDSQPTHGALSSFDATRGTLTYTPETGFTGSDSFTFSVTDGEDRSGVATMTIEVNADNGAPTANDDSATTAANTPVTVNVLANDSDPDGDSLSVLSTTTSTQGGSTAIESDGAVTYTPPADYVGTDTFDYTISDGTATAAATVAVTIDTDNHAPTAEDDTANADNEETITIDVLSNDSDPDGDALTVTTLDTSWTIGTATLNSDNTVTYVAPEDDATDRFLYTISDGNGGTDTAKVTINVD
ncbi:MAG: Ig-like domain-containing protein [Persicimonas sp.]